MLEGRVPHHAAFGQEQKGNQEWWHRRYELYFKVFCFLLGSCNHYKRAPCRQDPVHATSKVFQSPVVLELNCRRLVSEGEDGESRCSVFRRPYLKLTRRTRQRICHGGGRDSQPYAFESRIREFSIDCWTERRARKTILFVTEARIE
jgi:hypothetical protein